MKNYLKTHLYDRAGTHKLSILLSPLFIFGLIIKLCSAPFFSGHNFGSLFIPFLKYFTLSGGQDPYTYFYNVGIQEVFPYPQLMLYIMSVPGFIFKPLLNGNVFYITHTELFLYHIPILVADMVILLVLARWFKSKHQELLWLYWLSPILFYINYLHSQLDVIPMALVFVFLYFLFKERWLFAFAFLGAAIATKLHIIILVPLTLVYFWRRKKSLSTALLYTGVLSFIFFLINNIHLLSMAFQAIVFENREQIKIFSLQLHLGDTSIVYIIPSAYLLLLLHSLTFTHLNRDTFVMFLGFSFGILTLFIPPMQGWYYWVIPFFIYFYIKHEKESRLPFVFLTLSYFVYFALINTSDYLLLFRYTFPTVVTLPNLYSVLTTHNLPAELISNLGLTLLQVVLLVNVFWLYRHGVEESKRSKLYNMPYLIGIAGDSGSGKSTLAILLGDLFGEKRVAVVAGDAMHKWERGHTMWQKYTHLDPRANQLHVDLGYIKSLQEGSDIYRRQYDHHTGNFTVPEKLESKTLMIFEGLHSFFLSRMRQELDLKVFIKPDEQLRKHWKLRRDKKERGYTKEKVLTQLKAREHDAQEYISVQEKYADITLSLKSLVDITDDVIGSDFEPPVYLEITCDNMIDLNPLLETLATYVNIEHTFTDRHQIVSLTGSVSQTVIEHLSYTLVPELDDIVIKPPHWNQDHAGITQLFIAYYILESLNYHRSRPIQLPPAGLTAVNEVANIAQNLGVNCFDVQGGGGNVSVKLGGDLMAVKASGLRLEELQESSGFVGVDFKAIRHFFNDPRTTPDLTLLTKNYEGLVAKSRLQLPNSPNTLLRPSIETGFHALLDTVVIHTHSVYVNILTCSEEGQVILQKLFPDAAYIPYHTPGVDLTFAVSEALKKHPHTTFFLENHGVIVTGKTVVEAEERYHSINTKIKKWLRSVPSLPEISITTLPDGNLVSNNSALTRYILNHAKYLDTFNETMLFPDQVVYGTKFGFRDQEKPITIDTESGIITYGVSFREAQAFIETFVAWVYILDGIENRSLTLKTIPQTEGNLLINLESEKYRQRIIA